MEFISFTEFAAFTETSYAKEQGQDMGVKMSLSARNYAKRYLAVATIAFVVFGLTAFVALQQAYASYFVSIPQAKTNLVYDGSVQIGVEEGEGYTLTGDWSATNAGTYTAIATLNDTQSTSWNDKTTDPKTIEWTIEKKVIDLDITTSFEYTGSICSCIGEQVASVSLGDWHSAAITTDGKLYT